MSRWINQSINRLCVKSCATICTVSCGVSKLVLVQKLVCLQFVGKVDPVIGLMHEKRVGDERNERRARTAWCGCRRSRSETGPEAGHAWSPTVASGLIQRLGNSIMILLSRQLQRLRRGVDLTRHRAGEPLLTRSGPVKRQTRDVGTRGMVERVARFGGPQSAWRHLAAQAEARWPPYRVPFGTFSRRRTTSRTAARGRTAASAPAAAEPVPQHARLAWPVNERIGQMMGLVVRRRSGVWVVLSRFGLLNSCLICFRFGKVRICRQCNTITALIETSRRGGLVVIF